MEWHGKCALSKVINWLSSHPANDETKSEAVWLKWSDKPIMDHKSSLLWEAPRSLCCYCLSLEKVTELQQGRIITHQPWNNQEHYLEFYEPVTLIETAIGLSDSGNSCLHMLQIALNHRKAFSKSPSKTISTQNEIEQISITGKPSISFQTATLLWNLTAHVLKVIIQFFTSKPYLTARFKEKLIVFLLLYFPFKFYTF